MIYALADLHLDSTEKKSMTVFGNDWENYQKRIFENWKKIVKDKDIVLIPGDISWAMKVDEAKIDLKKIDDLPGKKIMMKGNHDYRWQSLKKLEDLKLNSIKFLQNNSFIVENYLICGTRGWVNEENNEFDEHDLKIYDREINRLKNSLNYINSDLEKIVMFHYPPFSYHEGKFNDFFELLKGKNVKYVIYGHLHGNGHKFVKEGDFFGIKLYCVSSDYLKFIPKKLK